MRAKIKDPANWLNSQIKEFLNGSPENSMQNVAREKAWDDFLLGFCAGDDAIYQLYKEEAIGPFHWTPAEVFNLHFPDKQADPKELTVISYILPQREITKADNRKENKFPAERWARARIFGEKVNAALRRRLVEALAEQGIDAVAPQLSPHWSRQVSHKYGFASSWSERHAAYAAGLGTFGLCDGLITPKGKAHRAGSVVARIQIPSTPRPYRNHREYCLFFSRGTCKKCMERCPAGAITENGKDKEKCLAHLKPTTSDYVKEHYKFDGYGCGLCQTGVPCESQIPIKVEGPAA